MVTFDRGVLVWTAPMEKQVSRIPMFLCSFALFGLGGMIGYAIVDVIRPTRDTLATSGLWIAIGMVAFFVSFGAWVFYCALNYVRPLGVQFFQNGVEMGEGRNRKLIPYVQLETFTCDLYELNHGTDTALFALRTVVSIATMNPAGLGRAIGESNKQPIYSHLTVKPRDSDQINFPLSIDDHKILAPLFRHRPRTATLP